MGMTNSSLPTQSRVVLPVAEKAYVEIDNGIWCNGEAVIIDSWNHVFKPDSKDWIKKGGTPKSRVGILSKAYRNRLDMTDPNTGLTYAELIAANMIDLALSDSKLSVSAASELADRTEGKSSVGINITDNDFTINIVHVGRDGEAKALPSTSD